MASSAPLAGLVFTAASSAALQLLYPQLLSWLPPQRWHQVWLYHGNWFIPPKLGYSSEAWLRHRGWIAPRSLVAPRGLGDTTNARLIHSNVDFLPLCAWSFALCICSLWPKAWWLVGPGAGWLACSRPWPWSRPGWIKPWPCPWHSRSLSWLSES